VWGGLLAGKQQKGNNKLENNGINTTKMSKKLETDEWLGIPCQTFGHYIIIRYNESDHDCRKSTAMSQFIIAPSF